MPEMHVIEEVWLSIQQYSDSEQAVIAQLLWHIVSKYLRRKNNRSFLSLALSIE